MAHLANSLRRAAGFAAAVASCFSGVTVGTLSPVPAAGIIGVRFPCTTVLTGAEFDCFVSTLSDSISADGCVVISVLEIGRDGGSTVVHRDFFVTVSVRLKGRGHDDGGGGGLTKVAGKAEVDSAGIQMHIVCRVAGQFTVFIRRAALRVAAEIHAAGKGDF